MAKRNSFLFINQTNFYKQKNNKIFLPLRYQETIRFIPIKKLSIGESLLTSLSFYHNPAV